MLLVHFTGAPFWLCCAPPEMANCFDIFDLGNDLSMYISFKVRPTYPSFTKGIICTAFVAIKCGKI